MPEPNQYAGWRQHFAGQPYPVPPGQSLDMGSVIPMIAQAMKVQESLGPEAFNTMTEARVGRSEPYQQMADIIGTQAPTQNELAGMQRFVQGQELGQSMGPLLATLANMVYTADKGINQALGRSGRVIPVDETQFGPTTSDASLANLMSAQAGIASSSPMLKFMYDLLTGGVTGERGPGARTKAGGAGPPRG